MVAQLGARLPKPDLVIVGEPTSMKVVDAHKGAHRFNVEVRGIEAHSSLSHLGVNAIEYAAPVLPVEGQNWDSDPFELSERGDRLYGRGSCDMKGFFTAIMAAVQSIDPKKLKQPIIVVATADEESGMAGAKKLLHEGRPQARYAVIGEPTSNRPIRMHKGILMESIRLVGSSGHSSDPSLGQNALEGMHHVIAALLRYRLEIQQQHICDDFAVPHPTLNFGAIKGGDNPNRICGDCELHLDARLVPGLSVNEVRTEIQRLATINAREFGLNVEFKALFDGIESMETSSASHIVKTCEALTGFSASSVDFATEAPFLNQLGMETVIMGPGSIKLAHQPNEYLELRELDRCRQLLEQLIQNLCLSSVEV